MGIIIFILIASALFGIFVGVQGTKSQINSVERRRSYAKTLGDHIRIVANDGIYFFYVDDLTQTYGIDESGTRYELKNIVSISINKNKITIHQNGTPRFVEIGTTEGIVPKGTIDAITAELLKVIRSKLNSELSRHSITPTKEYIHNGSIWGYDINSKKFYTTQYGISVYDFSDFLSVKTDNGREGNYKIAEKRIHVNVNMEKGGGSNSNIFEYDLYFDVVNDMYQDLLSMFKGILKRAHTSKQEKSFENNSQVKKVSKTLVNPTVCIQNINDVVKKVDQKQDTNLENMVELFICALFKYAIDRTPILRREKLKLFDACMAKVGYASEINGTVIYSEIPIDDAKEIIVAFDSMAIGFPEIVCTYADRNDASVFLAALISFVQWEESYIAETFDGVKQNNASAQYINELKDMLKSGESYE